MLLKFAFNAGTFMSLSISSQICCNLLLKCALQPKIAYKSLNPLILGFKVLEGHRWSYPWTARQQCLL